MTMTTIRLGTSILNAGHNTPLYGANGRCRTAEDVKNMNCTAPCKFGQRCNKKRCNYAHSPDELVLQTCRFDMNCIKDNCRFYHSCESREDYLERRGFFPDFKEPEPEALEYPTHDDTCELDPAYFGPAGFTTVEKQVIAEMAHEVTRSPNFSKPCCHVVMGDDHKFTRCTRKKCTFAHGFDEWRPITCKWGEKCQRRDCSYFHPRSEDYFSYAKRCSVALPLASRNGKA